LSWVYNILALRGGGILSLVPDVEVGIDIGEEVIFY